jgi:hypothetical protein
VAVGLGPDDSMGDGVTLPAELWERLDDVRPAPADMSMGGQGSLYLARWIGPDDAYGQEVVVKQMTFRREREAIWRFWRHADRPHITRLVWCKHVAGYDYEVTVYHRLGSLRRFMEEHHPTPPDRVGEILSQLTEALTAIHLERVLHGDIKPENVLIQSWDPLNLSLVDFGISLIVSGATIEAPPEGTIRYLAPERLRGERGRARYNYPSDWWSLGIVVAELLLGRFPIKIKGVPADSPDLDPNEVEHRLADEIRERPVDAAAFLGELRDVDSRWVPLVNGLLTESTRLRWTGTQVTAWLTGDNPDVAPRGPEAADRGFGFAGTTAHTPRQLADLMRRNWTLAGELLTSVDLQLLVEWARRLGERGVASMSPGLVEGLRKLQRDRPDVATTRAIKLLDADGRATFRGEVLDGSPTWARNPASAPQSAGVARLAAETVRLWGVYDALPGQREREDTVTALWTTNALRLMSGPGADDLLHVNTVWRHWHGVATRVFARVPDHRSNPLDDGLLRALLLAAAADEQYALRLRDQAIRPARQGRRRSLRADWFRSLHDDVTGTSRRVPEDDLPAYHAVMVLCAPRTTSAEERVVSPEAREEARAELAGFVRRVDRDIARRARPTYRRGRRLRLAVLSAVGLYCLLVAFAASGVAVGTSPAQGAMTAGFLISMGAWLPAAMMVRSRRLARALIGGWAGALLGLVVAAGAGGLAAIVDGPGAGWPAFWVSWVLAIVTTAMWGAAE